MKHLICLLGRQTLLNLVADRHGIVILNSSPSAMREFLATVRSHLCGPAL
jgi:hypothetical protein